MARLVVSSCLWALTLSYTKAATLSHGGLRKSGLLFEQAFSDSGFWDFALLAWYDSLVRRLVIFGVTSISELGWTERALLASAEILNEGPGLWDFESARDASSLLFSLGQNYILVLASMTLIAASGGWFSLLA